MVGPGCLPAGLEKRLVPTEVDKRLNIARSGDGDQPPMDEEEAILDVATSVTTSFGYSLKVVLALPHFVEYMVVSCVPASRLTHILQDVCALLFFRRWRNPHHVRTGTRKRLVAFSPLFYLRILCTPREPRSTCLPVPSTRSATLVTTK